MNKIRAIIIDDELSCVKMLSFLLNDYHPDVEVLDVATSMTEGLAKIEKHKDKLDLIFLDVQMPGGDGFTLLQRLPKINFKVIFTTAFDEFAIKAIKFSALDYLLKPIDDEELTQAINKYKNALTITPWKEEITHFKQALQEKKVFEKIAVPNLNEIKFILVNQIAYLEGDNNYTTICLDQHQKIISSKHLAYYEDLLEPYGFFRIHRSYLVNTKKVVSFIKGKNGLAQLENGVKLEVSGRRKDEFLEKLGM